MRYHLKWILPLFFIFLLSCPTRGQAANNYQLISTRDFSNTSYNERVVKFGISQEKNLFIKYNPVNLAFGGLMFVYQKFISPQIQAQCLFVPSCSEYSRQLYNEYGFLKGTFTTADRLTRCHRISATTINPVSVNKHDHKVHESADYYRLDNHESKK